MGFHWLKESRVFDKGPPALFGKWTKYSQIDTVRTYLHHRRSQQYTPSSLSQPLHTMLVAFRRLRTVWLRGGPLLRTLLALDRILRNLATALAALVGFLFTASARRWNARRSGGLR